MTQDEADAIISYLEIMEEATDHVSNLRKMKAYGFSETELDKAARALGKIAGRDYSIL